MVNNCSEDSKEYEILKKLCILPLLPSQKIEEGIKYIENLIETDVENNEILKNYMEKYINNNLMTKVTPSVFCVFDAIDRANNYFKNNIRHIIMRVGSRGNVYDLLGNIF